MGDSNHQNLCHHPESITSDAREQSLPRRQIRECLSRDAARGCTRERAAQNLPFNYVQNGSSGQAPSRPFNYAQSLQIMLSLCIGTKWNQADPSRNQAESLQIMRSLCTGTKWNQVEPSTEPSKKSIPPMQKLSFRSAP